MQQGDAVSQSRTLSALFLLAIGGELRRCRLPVAEWPRAQMAFTRDIRFAFGPLQDLHQPTEILRGIASCAFFRVRVRTPSSSLALICCWSILFDNVNDRAKCPTLYSV